MKNTKGITLIALVVTIVVLLILSGVAINLVAGGDGIMAKAQNAINLTNEAEAKERVNLKIAEFKTDFYNAVYVEKNVSVNVKFGDWVAQEYAGEVIKAGAYEFTISGTAEPYTITILENNRLQNDIIGTMTADGKATWNDENGNVVVPPDDPEEDDEQVTPAVLYSVTYNANGGIGSVPAEVEYVEGATVEVNFATFPTKEGFEFLGWAEQADATEATFAEDGTKTFSIEASDVILYAVWKDVEVSLENYGEYVDLGTTILPRTDGVITQKLGGENPTEQPLTDWRIFHKDANGTYLIMSDYLPYTHEDTLGTGLLNEGTDYPYNWKSGTSRADLLERLNGTASAYNGVNPWNNLIANDYILSGMSVKGAIDVENWIESWNANGYTELFIQHIADTNTYSAEGYFVGIEPNPTTEYQDISSDTVGYGNTLYFPHTVDISNAYGHWLASPAANYANNLMHVDYSGLVSSGYSSSYARSVRPTVFIPAGIELEKVDGIWEVKE